MPADLNFEAAPLVNEAAFETEQESEVVRNRRPGFHGVEVRRTEPRVRFAPGFGRPPAFRNQTFFPRQPNLFNRPRFFGSPAFRQGPAMGRPAFFGAPFFGGGFGRRNFFGQGGFRGGRFFGGSPFRGFGFRRRAGFSPFGRFAFLGDTGFQGGSSQLSEVVAWAQSCLSQTGFEVPQNGILGPRTRRAISEFQSQQQLAPTGALDMQTIEALQAACSQQDAGDQSQGGGQ
jgi:hypothetical protein